VKPVSDVFSMRATLYYLMTGAFPFDFPEKRDPIDVILNENVVPIRSRRSAILKPLAAVIDQAVTKKHKDRYRDVGELLAAAKKAIS